MKSLTRPLDSSSRTGLRRMCWMVVLATGCATHQIRGTVTDRNGEPMDRVVISLKPGGVELITDSEGAFTIDYLRDSEGNRVRLEKRTEYTVEAFKTGYHVASSELYYKKGDVMCDVITLKEDTIRVDASEDNIDPARFIDKTHSAGTNYEGE
jgi:hypothetical protein